MFTLNKKNWAFLGNCLDVLQMVILTKHKMASHQFQYMKTILANYLSNLDEKLKKNKLFLDKRRREKKII